VGKTKPKLLEGGRWFSAGACPSIDARNNYKDRERTNMILSLDEPQDSFFLPRAAAS
jgi:hypothetical protein